MLTHMSPRPMFSFREITPTTITKKQLSDRKLQVSHQPMEAEYAIRKHDFMEFPNC